MLATIPYASNSVGNLPTGAILSFPRTLPQFGTTMPSVRELHAKNTGVHFELGYDPTKCLTPDQITMVQADFASNLANENRFKKVLELGVGSGVFLTQMLLDSTTPGMQVRGIDIDENALEIARHNLSRAREQRRLSRNAFSLAIGDWMSQEPIRKTPDIDLIYCNPPYLPEGTALRPEFVDNPHHAMFAADEGMAHYKTVIAQSKLHLKDGGYLFLRTSNDAGRTAGVGELLERNLPGSQIDLHHFQSEHRRGTGFLVKFSAREI
jgi:methylase of polypeptide subunit release factors